MPKISDFVEIVRIFEDNIQRSFAPSLVFFVMLGTADVLFGVLPRTLLCPGAGERLQWWIDTVGAVTLSPALVILVLLVVLIGTSYALSTLHQVLFDDRLMGCFNPWLPLPIPPPKVFRKLRKAVVERLQTDPEIGARGWTWQIEQIREDDFALYEILGGIDPTPTQAYVHRSKSIGVFFVSLMLVLGLFLWRAGGLPALAGLLPVWYLGREAVRAQYRARAVRLYVNFLMIPEGSILHQLRGKFGPADPPQREGEGAAAGGASA